MMRLIFISTVMVMFLSEQLLAQELPSINKVHQRVVEGPAIGVAVEEVPSGYMVFSGQRGWSGSNFSPFTSQFNHEGSLMEEQEFDYGFNGRFAFLDPITRGQNAVTYYGGVTLVQNSPRYDSAFVVQWDTNGDTIFSRFVMADTVLLLRRCVQAANGDLLFTGLHEPPKEQFCLRTDSLGVVKDWFAFPGFDGRGIAVDDLGFIYLAGNWIYPDTRGSLIKCDSTGSVQWIRYHSVSPTTQSVYRSVIALADGSVMVLAAFTRFNLPLLGWNGGSVARYSAQGVLLWEDTVRMNMNDNYACAMSDGYQRSGDELIMAGHYGDEVHGHWGFVTSYSIGGEQQWYRQFTYYDSLGSVGPHLVNDIEPTSDGGMVLTGEAWNYQQQAPQNIWLVKLDSLGCLVPGCQEVGVQQYVLGLQDRLHISPNPASDLVNVLLELPEGGAVQGQAQVQLLDASGRMVLAEKVQQNFNQLRATLDVNALPSGTYYLHLRDGKRWLAGGKVVVQH